MREDRFPESLPCPLTDEDKLDASATLVDQLALRDDLKAELKEFTAVTKESIVEIDARVSALAKAIRTGEEVRQVYCVERANYAIDQVEIIRTDTGEVVRTRAFEHDERQTSLAFVSDGGDLPDPLTDELDDDQIAAV